jgi:DNA replication and repair protein RecF
VATLRSFRGARADELVAFAAGEARLRAEVERAGLHRTLVVRLAPRRRQAEVDGKTAASAADDAGGLTAVVFAPEDLRLPKGSPQERRRFLDRAVFETRPAFLREALDYQRLLRHRNALLRRHAGGAPPPLGVLEAYDERLAGAGAVVVRERRRLLDALRGRFARAFAAIGRMPDAADLTYACAPAVAAADDDAAVAAALLAGLEGRRERDLARGFTSVGPHVDDLRVDLGGRPAAAHASQGQIRALVLALKIAEITHVLEITGDPPVLLLDDVSSELDPERNRALFAFLGQVGCQTLITTTDPEHVRLEGGARRFAVAAGRVDPEPRRGLPEGSF